MKRVGILVLGCLLTWGCAGLRSPSAGPWTNPPLAQRPSLDVGRLEAAVLLVKDPTGKYLDSQELSALANGVLVFSLKTEDTIPAIGAVFTPAAWQAFAEWVNQIYQDGKVRWTVLEEANRR